MELKIMTFNIQHCNKYTENRIDIDAFADTIIKSGADIIGLNEVRGEGQRADYTAQAEILSEKTGYYYGFAKAIDVDGCNPYGNAILSKYPIISLKTVPIPDPVSQTGNEPYETRCILHAEIELPEKTEFLITHFGLNKDEQTGAVDTLLRLIKNKRCVLMGDFNAEPNNSVLSPLFDILSDCSAQYCSDKLSFPSDEPTKKIDYILTSKDIKTLSADIPEIIVSDHRPHTAVIEIL